MIMSTIILYLAIDSSYTLPYLAIVMTTTKTDPEIIERARIIRKLTDCKDVIWSEEEQAWYDADWPRIVRHGW